MAPGTQFELANPPADAISALVFGPGDSTKLLVSSWDRNVYLYDTAASSEQEQGQRPSGALLRTVAHRAPVLDVCFGADDETAFSAGMDWTVRRLDLSSSAPAPAATRVLSRHEAPVRRVVYGAAHSLLVSASWDGTLHVHDVAGADNNSSNGHDGDGHDSPPLVIPLPAKPHALAASPSKVIVAMTSRLVHIYDLATLRAAVRADRSAPPPLAWQERESSLKFLTRAVAAMPSDAGYATSSIEGRVAVEWFDASAESQARKYAFKCHRQTATTTAADDGNPKNGAATTDVVYPVNALAFHPTHNKTFASGGGDATIALWDAEAKRRMKIYQKFPDSIAALAFSADGRRLAIGVCPGFETGMEDYSAEGRTSVLIRELAENEARGKGAK